MSKAITCKSLPQTNTKPSRIVASDLDGNRLVLSNPEDTKSFWTAAEKFCKKMNWTGKLCGGAIKDGYVFVFCDEDPQ